MLEVPRDSELEKIVQEKISAKDFKMDALLSAIIGGTSKRTPQSLLKNVDPESLLGRFQKLAKNLEELNLLLTWQELIPLLRNDHGINVSVPILRKLKNNHAIDASSDEVSYVIPKEDLEKLITATTRILGDEK